MSLGEGRSSGSFLIYGPDASVRPYVSTFNPVPFNNSIGHIMSMLQLHGTPVRSRKQRRHIYRRQQRLQRLQLLRRHSAPS